MDTANLGINAPGYFLLD